MSAPRRSIKSRSQHYDVAATITPETGFKVSLMQACVIVGAIFVVGVGYAYLVWGQSATSKDVQDIKASQIAIVTRSLDVQKDQEDKRTALGKEFLASNALIVKSIGDLTTLTAVQQERQKSTDEKLEKVLMQIGNKLDQPAARVR